MQTPNETENAIVPFSTGKKIYAVFVTGTAVGAGINAFPLYIMPSYEVPFLLLNAKWMPVLGDWAYYVAKVLGISLAIGGSTSNFCGTAYTTAVLLWQFTKIAPYIRTHSRREILIRSLQLSGLLIICFPLAGMSAVVIASEAQTTLFLTAKDVALASLFSGFPVWLYGLVIELISINKLFVFVKEENPVARTILAVVLALAGIISNAGFFLGLLTQFQHSTKAFIRHAAIPLTITFTMPVNFLSADWSFKTQQTIQEDAPAKRQYPVATKIGSALAIFLGVFSIGTGIYSLVKDIANTTDATELSELTALTLITAAGIGTFNIVGNLLLLYVTLPFIMAAILYAINAVCAPCKRSSVRVVEIHDEETAATSSQSTPQADEETPLINHQTSKSWWPSWCRFNFCWGNNNAGEVPENTP